jgi:hypothetical protein
VDLEHRVSMLEQELTILKNQIQTTLLDIQEQLLTGQYPALRAEGSAPAEGHEPAPPRVIPASDPQEWQPREAPAESESWPARAVKVTAEEIATDDTRPDDPPLVRKISLDDVEPSQAVEQTLAEAFLDDEPTELLPLPTTVGNDWMTFISLTDWAQKSVERLGAVRSRKLIEVYAKAGFLTPEVEYALRQIIALYADDTLPEPAWMDDTVDMISSNLKPAQMAQAGLTRSDIGASGAHRSATVEQKRQIILRMISGIKQLNVE